MTTEGARERIERLLVAARRIADPADPMGAVPRLVASTGLSAEGVRLALDLCLETQPEPSDLERLLTSAVPVPRAHVVLSSSVFTAAHRALALALASTAHVEVRPSRRQPAMVELLASASGGGLFRRVERLSAEAGESVYVYGTDATIDELRRSLTPGVVLHGHGAGLGVAVCEFAAADGERLERAAAALISDVILFDQRGCLSPRVCWVMADAQTVMAFARSVAQQLEQAAVRIPRGLLSPAEQAEWRTYVETWSYAGEYIDAAGEGGVSVDLNGAAPAVPPIGRYLHVVRASDPLPALESLAAHITTLGTNAGASIRPALSAAVPRARLCDIGRMQMPPLDGPVDGRTVAEPVEDRRGQR